MTLNIRRPGTTIVPVSVSPVQRTPCNASADRWSSLRCALPQGHPGSHRDSAATFSGRTTWRNAR